jgi:hypothetical protein
LDETVTGFVAEDVKYVARFVEDVDLVGRWLREGKVEVLGYLLFEGLFQCGDGA